MKLCLCKIRSVKRSYIDTNIINPKGENMKKSLIAASASAVALAAMPVVGVFAAGTGDVTTTTTDTLTLSVQPGCSIATANNGGSNRSDVEAAFGNVTPSQTATDTTDPIVVTCNGAWTLTPSISKELSLNGDGTTSVISSSIAGGLDGDTSEWALMLTPGTTLAGTNGFESYAAVNGTTNVKGNGSVAALSITPSYKVSVAPGQPSGNYSGTVLYTVAIQN